MTQYACQATCILHMPVCMCVSMCVYTASSSSMHWILNLRPKTLHHLCEPIHGQQLLDALDPRP